MVEQNREIAAPRPLGLGPAACLLALAGLLFALVPATGLLGVSAALILGAHRLWNRP